MSDVFKNASETAKTNFERFQLYMTSRNLDKAVMENLVSFAEYFYLAGKIDKMEEIAELKRNGEL